jgi:hypothetical protein
VVYALYLLGGDTQRVHTEDVALKCFELSPASFSWVRHPQHPDKDIVRVALTDARKEQNGALVEGRTGQRLGLSAKTRRKPVDDGWMLSSQGILWIQEHFISLQQIGGGGLLKEHRQKVLKQLKRVREHRLFQMYMDTPDRFVPSVGEIADLLRCRVDAEMGIWQHRFAKVRALAESVDQQDVLEFIAKCEHACGQEH